VLLPCLVGLAVGASGDGWQGGQPVPAGGERLAPGPKAGKLRGWAVRQVGRIGRWLRQCVVAGAGAVEDALADPAAQFGDQTAVSGCRVLQVMEDLAGFP
jgi:hypothetical protein